MPIRDSGWMAKASSGHLLPTSKPSHSDGMVAKVPAADNAALRSVDITIALTQYLSQ